MCHPAAPMEMKRRSIFVDSVRRVPPPKDSSSHRISPYSRILGASARVTFASNDVGVPTQVSFTEDPTVARLLSTSKGAHSRRCAGSVSACQTLSGEWRSSLTRMSVHFSPSFRTCAPLAGPGVYCSRSVIFFSLASSSLALVAVCVSSDPCGRGGVREHVGERTRTGETEPATHRAPGVVRASAGRDGAVRPPWILRNRPLATPAGALTRSAAPYEADARSLQPTAVTRPAGSISRGGSAPQ